MEEKIKATLEELRAMLQADGGDLELVAIQGTKVMLRLQGASQKRHRARPARAGQPGY